MTEGFLITLAYLEYQKAITEIRITEVRLQSSEAATRGVLLKKVFIKISQISQKNTCVGNKAAKLRSQAYSFIKKDSNTDVNIFKICKIFKKT